MKLNLKGWKKIVEEKDHSILRNKDNHELKILHKGLHPATRGQLASLELAQGGEVKMANGGSVPEPDKKKAKEMQAGATQSGWQPDQWVANAKAAVGMAEGGEVDSEETQEPVTFSTEMPVIPEELANPNPGSMATPMLPSGVNEMTPEQIAVSYPGEQPYGTPVGGIAPPPAEAPAPTPTRAPDSVAPTAAAPVAATPAPVVPDMGAKGLGEIEQGMKREQAAIAAQAAGQQLVLQEQQRNMAEGHRQYQAQFDELENERKSLIKDINEGHVDPSHFMDNMGGGQKIATIIGLIAGGISSGMTGRENLAMKVLDQQIDRDIAAQKAALGKKETLLSANMRQFGNLREAEQMTRVMQADVIANKMQQEAAKSASPQAQARLMQEAGKIHLQYAPIVQKLAANKAIASLTKGAQADPSKAPALIQAVEAVDPARAKDLQGRFVPGIGFANTPDDAKLAKETMIRKDNIEKNVAEIVAMVQKHGTNEFLGSHNEDLERKLDQVATDMAKLQDPSSVARPGEVEMVKKTLAAPGIFKRDSSALKMMEGFKREVESRANTALSRHGLAMPDPIKKLPQEQQNMAKWARANPSNPKSAIVLKKLGLQ